MKVLIVDDNAVNLHGMVHLFSMNDDLLYDNSQIDVTQDVAEAYQKFLEADGDYDLVITDGDLGTHLTGPMLAQLILSKKPQQAIAGWTDSAQRREEFQHIFKFSKPQVGTRLIWDKNIGIEHLKTVNALLPS